MTDTTELIVSLEAVVAADPRNAPVRLHLAHLLLVQGRAADCLEHVRAVLGQRPTDVAAIELAARAAADSGDREAADGYGRLLAALGASAAPSPAPAPSTVSELPSPPPEASAPPAQAPTEPPAEASSSLLEPLLDPPSSRVQEPDGEAEQDDEEYGNDEEYEEDADEDEIGGEVVRLRVIDGGAGGDDDELYGGAEIPSVTLADVAGLEAVKRRLELAFLAPLRNPEIRRMYGKTMRGGLLLYGPPGCGKTFLARATAGELGVRFVSVGLSDVLDMWMGQSERNLHELFELARRQAPCVLFFDEIDALGRKRSLMRHQSSMTTVVNQFLAEMDGVDSANEGLFVLAATNHPWDVDTALRRPGRLDRTLLVLPPDKPAREAILEQNLVERPTEKLDIGWVAARTDGFSGADLAHLCETAVEHAMEESLKTGKARPIRHKDLKKAFKELRPSTRPWFDTARNFALFSNEGGVYDDLVAYLREKKMV